MLVLDCVQVDNELPQGFIDNPRCYNVTVTESVEFKIEAVGQVTARLSHLNTTFDNNSLQ